MTESVLDRLYGVIATPVQTLRDIARERPLAWAIVILGTTSLTGFLQPSEAQYMDFLSNIGPAQARLLTWLFGLTSTLLMLGTVHWIAHAFGGTGPFTGLVSAYGFSRFPALLNLPIALLAQAAVGRVAGTLSFVMALWLFVLYIIAVRETYGISTGATIFVSILAVTAMVILMALFVATGILGLSTII